MPFYKESFRLAGISYQHLRHFTIADLHLLPVLEKDDLRRFGKTTLVSNQREKGGLFFNSSGSTGTPVSILLSPAMHQRWFAIYEARVRNWAGVSSAMPRGMIGGRRIIADAGGKPPFYRYNYFEKQVYFSAYHISKQNAYNYLKGITSYGVEYMTGYAMSNYLLAQFFKETGLQPPQLQAVVTSSEKLTTPMRRLFAEVYGCKTFDGWGSVESCGLVTECEQGSLHISEDAGIVELLNEAGEPAKPGEWGTVYCTGLLNYDQPLVRYKIGDTMVASAATCTCGRSMPLIAEITGRVEDIIVGTDGRRMVRFHSVFNGLATIKQAQVIQESLENITIKIVTAGKPDTNELKLIKERIISQLGAIQITIEEVAAIPLTANGKFKAVVSKLDKKLPPAMNVKV